MCMRFTMLCMKMFNVCMFVIYTIDLYFVVGICALQVFLFKLESALSL